jgi:hypothetical protein
MVDRVGAEAVLEGLEDKLELGENNGIKLRKNNFRKK